MRFTSVLATVLDAVPRFGVRAIIGVTLATILGAGHADAAMITVPADGSASGKLNDDDFDGSGDSGGGAVDVRETEGSQQVRGVLRFVLPVAPAGQVLVAATLNLPVITEDRLGSYQVGLYHSVTQNQTFRNLSLYNDASFARAAAGVAIPNQPEGFIDTSFSIDVLPEIVAEYAADPGDPNTWFRLSLEDPSAAVPVEAVAANGNGIDEFIRVADGQNGVSATLTLTFVPEPSSLAILAAVAIGAITTKRSRIAH